MHSGKKIFKIGRALEGGELGGAGIHFCKIEGEFTAAVFSPDNTFFIAKNVKLIGNVAGGFAELTAPLVSGLLQGRSLLSV